jgi:hypothetical protein
MTFLRNTINPFSLFSLQTPAWVTVAKVVLLLKDDNGTTIADSVSCVYDTRFETSLMTFRGEISSQNLLYGGSLQEDGNDVETTVYSSEAVAMDFFDQVSSPCDCSGLWNN